MANPLTGDFDLVAEFSVQAANRVLAAMHSNQRFLHSISGRVDDNPSPDSAINHSTVVGSVDSFGDPTANQGQIGRPFTVAGQLVTNCPISSALGQVINADALVAITDRLVPSHFQGRVQAQLFPPTVSVPDASGTKLTVTLAMMSRYFPDANTPPLAEFIRGELRITAEVNQFTSQTANVLEIDFKADQANVNFVPTWSSQPLSQEDKAGINLAIHNALKTSFLPSNITLPADIAFVQMKTLPGPLSGIAILVNTHGVRGNPSSMTANFMGSQDQFAFAVAPSFIADVFQPVIDSIVSQPPQNITIPIDLVLTTAHVVYSIALNHADLALLDGKIVLTVKGHATELSHKWYAPDSFDFTAKFGFTLKADGSTADLVPGDVSLDTSSWIVDLFKSSATSGIRQARDQALQHSGAFGAVRNTLDANRNLGGLLGSLLKPLSSRFFLPGEEVVLAYSSVEIRSTGIVLHGSLSVVNVQPVFIRGTKGTSGGAPSPGADWPAPYVEFEQIPPSARDPVTASIPQAGPHYSALKSWIPGGTIDRYEWRVQGESVVDANRFVYIPPSLEMSDGTPVTTPVSAFEPVCLTVRGSRVSSSGAVVSQPVVASVCSYLFISLISAELVSGVNGVLPTVTLTQSGANGQIVVAGHTPASAGTPGVRTPNLLVHFADQKTVEDLQLLVMALRDSNRPYLSTAIVAVLSPGLIANAQHTRGIVYAEDYNGDWERLFGITNARRPLTLIVDANGKTVWRHQGPLNRNALADALREYPTSRGSVFLGLFRSNARILQPAPNFIFDYAPGRQLALRKLAGKPAILVFWRSSSQASIDAVHDAESTSSQPGNAATVLAINDGESPDLIGKVAAENKLTATIVTDPKREISIAYGVNVWPTVIELDALGLVTGIRHGRDMENHAEPLSQPAVGQRS